MDLEGSISSENKIWKEVTKERGESIHYGINKYFFEKLLFVVPYKEIAQALLPENPVIENNRLKDLSHSTRLRIYNNLYRIAQYFHYTLMGVSMFAASTNYAEGDFEGTAWGSFSVLFNAVISLNIAYNRRGTRRRIKIALEKEKAIKKENALNKKETVSFRAPEKQYFFDVE